MQDRAAVLPVQVTPDAGKQRSLQNTFHYTITHYAHTYDYTIEYNILPFTTVTFTIYNYDFSASIVGQVWLSRTVKLPGPATPLTWSLPRSV